MSQAKTSTLEDILIFKTSIANEQDVSKIASVLNSDPAIRKWNIDYSDCDHVLRIESEQRNISYFISLISQAGFLCEELVD